MEATDLTTQLIIRASNQKIEDQVVCCNPNWTVKKLKDYLSEVYPRRPEVQDQKLIYSGHLLDDNLSLKDVFGGDDNHLSVIRILHLVCNSSNSNAEVYLPSDPNINQVASNEDPVVVSEPVQNEHSSAFYPVQSFNYPRQRFMQQSHPNSLSSFPQFPSVPISNNQFNPDLIITQQFSLMQQMYASYIAQYMQRMQIHQPSTVSVPAEVPTVSPPLAPPVVNTSDNAQNDVQNNVAPHRQENVNVRMNAHGGPVLEDEDDEHRDWLDFFYLGCRFIVLLTIVYFYSSPERFALVSSLAFLIYLYQEMWLARRERNDRLAPSQQHRQNERNQVDEHPNNSDEALPPNNDFTEADIPGAHEVERVMDGDEPLHVNHSQVNRITGPIWTFISSFFLSLLPEQPTVPVNIN